MYKTTKLINVRVDDILMIEAKEHYMYLFRENDKIVFHARLGDIFERISGSSMNFIRVHKSFVISKTRITEVEGNIIKLDNDMKVPIGNSYKKAFLSYLKSTTFGTKIIA